MKSVLVGISGGVDSSVVAHLLKKQGFHVEGILLKQVNEPADCDDYVCCSENAIQRARSVCDQLNITLHTPDVRRLFNLKVIAPSIKSWELGDVPSPCTACNADLRAPLLDYYRRVLQCDYFATGHYFINDNGRILRGSDPAKDQSYMVSLVDKHLFNHWLTPLGGMLKSDVRKLAFNSGMNTALTPDSQNLCFNHLLPSFDREIVKMDGECLIGIGRHNGRPAVGQRKGFAGNTVVEVLHDKVIVGSAAPMLSKLNVVWRNKPLYGAQLTAQAAYHGTKHAVSALDSTSITLVNKVVANAGQVVAVYMNDDLVGGGVIRK